MGSSASEDLEISRKEPPTLAEKYLVNIAQTWIASTAKVKHVGVSRFHWIPRSHCLELDGTKQPERRRFGMLLIVVILVLVFGLGGGYYGHGRWGAGGGAGVGLGTVLLILLVCYLLGVFH